MPKIAPLSSLLSKLGLTRFVENVKNVACVWPARSTHVATSRNNVARCCVEMLRAFGQAFSFPYIPLEINICWKLYEYTWRKVASEIGCVSPHHGFNKITKL